jgi:hypothetical protein
MMYNFSRGASLFPIAVLCTVATGDAQEPSISDAQGRPSRAIDRATVLIRREVLARTAERAREFDLVKELAPVPAAAPPADPLVLFERLPNAGPIRANHVVGARGLRLMEPQEGDNGEDADGNSPAQPQIVVAEQSFELRVFRFTGGDASTARKLIESFQTNRIEKIAREHRLSPDEKSKLILAARGDLKRVFDRIDESRKQFRLLRTDFNRCRDFLLDLQPFHLIVSQSLDEPDTLLAKTLKKITAADGHGRVAK